MSRAVTYLTALRQIDRVDPLRLPSGNQSRLGAFKRVSLNISVPIWNKSTMARTEPVASVKTQNVFQIGTKRFETLMEVHKKLLDAFEQVQRERLARTMEETRLASEFAAKVTSARSIPDIMAIYQQWITKCEEMIAEDGRKFLDDSQKVANAALSLLSNGEERTQSDKHQF
jgi:hypothetical protein